MKFSVSSSELLRHLQIASGAIASSPVLPILDDFLFTISKNQLTIAATDLETSITNQLEVMSDGDGAVAIPAKILLDTLKALPDQPITIAVDEETYGITITSAYGKYRLAGENGQDYPRIPESDKVDSVNVPATTLIKAINKTLFATSNDELRPAMTGVYVTLDFNKLTFVATDAHKLVKYSFQGIAGEVATSFIIPKKALNLLKNALPADVDVKMAFDKANAFFTFGDTHLVCRLIDARYPDYNAVIPVDNPNTLSIKRSDLQSSLKRIAIYANKTTNQVILDISPDSLTVSAQAHHRFQRQVPRGNAGRAGGRRSENGTFHPESCRYPTACGAYRGRGDSDAGDASDVEQLMKVGEGKCNGVLPAPALRHVLR
jgi:DNA polymerase III subunit beta